jgi:NhaC family Na+:H+ antiporter
MTTATKPQKNRPAFLWEALFPVVVLIVMIRESLVRYEGAAHIPLLLAAAIAALVGMRAGHRWQDIEEGIISGVSVGLKPILILLVVGMLIGTWIAGGIVPILIYHWLKLLSPSILLVSTCLICCVVSLATGQGDHLRLY